MTQHLVYNEDIKSKDLYSIYQYVEGKYNVYAKDSIKEYVKMSKRIEKCKSDIYFITSCLRNNKLPNFTQFKVTNNRLRSQPIYKTMRKLILTTELSNHNSDLNKYHKYTKTIFKRDEVFKIPSDELNSIIFVLDRELLSKYSLNCKQKILKKLNYLGIDINLNDMIVDPTFITQRNNKHKKSHKGVFDLTNSLNDNEKDLLNLGLKYGVSNRHFNHFECLASLEELASKLVNETTRPNPSNDNSSTSQIDSFMQKLQNLTQEYINSSDVKQNSLSFDEEKTLNNLKKRVKDEELIINKSDKGNAAVINKRSIYIEKMEHLFSDKTKFKLLEKPDSNLIEKIEKDFNKSLLDITDSLDKTRELFDSNGNKFHPILKAGSLRIPLYKRIHSAGAKCAIAYGLTKVHKKDYPIRPIISTIGTHNYETSGYLCSVLQDHFNNQTIAQTTNLINNTNNNQWCPTKQRFQYTLKDSFDFINKVSKLKLNEENFIISIDVESLFTNVPIDETLEIIKQAFFRKKSEIIKKTEKNIGTKTYVKAPPNMMALLTAFHGNTLNI